MKKFMAFLLVFLLTAGMLFGCSSAKENGSGDRFYGAVEDSQLGSSAGSTLADGTQNTAGEVNTNQKLVRKLWLSVETEDLDTLLTGIDERISQLGGYVEAREVQNGSMKSAYRYRNADITVRVPADKLSAFAEHVTQNTNVISSNETAEDITLTYVATESKVKALETEQTRLLELLAKAESMSDVLSIEKRLTEVRTELESVTSKLRLYDNQVSYGTIYLSISEVKEYTETTEPETVWQRIGKGFVQSLKNLGEFFTELFVAVVVGIPYILLVAAALTGLILLFKGIKKRKKNKPQPDPE